MTLKEIAARAGVSISTVSRVVNSKNVKAASPEVCDKIWQIVRETGYTPNSSAQSLQQGSTSLSPQTKGKIYVIFSRRVDSYIDPFFTELLHAVEMEAFSRRYPIQTVMSNDDLYNFSAENIDKYSAAIILGQISENNLAMLKSRFRNLAYIGLNALPESAMIDQILCSGYKAARSAVAYLADLGHRRILYRGDSERGALPGIHGRDEASGLFHQPGVCVQIPAFPSGWLWQHG